MMRVRHLLSTVLLLALSLGGATAHPIPVADKTPSDVYALAMVLTAQVERLRAEHGVLAPWPSSPLFPNRQPRHVYQKALEILEKIDRHRRLHRLGPISVSDYVGRDITPNEVYDQVARLVDELQLLLDGEPPAVVPVTEVMTPEDVYRALAEVSLALDTLLGRRGFTPSDVYARALQVVELARFLRRSQHLPPAVELPPRPAGLHSNHALAASHRLLGRIAEAERRLWMAPVTVPDTPRRVITPTDVYDALHLVLGELNRIQYRLGLERRFPLPEATPGKSPDDVVQLLEWAGALLPGFSAASELVQFDRASLTKGAGHAHRVTERIIELLHRLLRERGIQQRVGRLPLVGGTLPRHAFQKGIGVLTQLSALRQRLDMGRISVPRHPLRRVGYGEVFALVSRLENELELIYRRELGVAPGPRTALDEHEHEMDATREDALYRNLWTISRLLDTLFGPDGFPEASVYREALRVCAETQLIARWMGVGEPVRELEPEPREADADVARVHQRAGEVLALVQRVQRRAGMFRGGVLTVPAEVSAGPPELFNRLHLVLAELEGLKLHLGIAERAPLPLYTDGGEPPGMEAGDALYHLTRSARRLERLLNHDPGEAPAPAAWEVVP